MLFSMLVPLSRLISLLTCNLPAKWIDLVRLAIFIAVLLTVFQSKSNTIARMRKAHVCDELKGRRVRIRPFS